MTLLSHFEVRVACMRSNVYVALPNQYSCLTYTAWVETLYTGIGRTAILFFPCKANVSATYGGPLQFHKLKD